MMKANIVSVNAATVAVVLALGGATAATAAPGSLQGRYGLSGMGACLASPGGFDQDNVAIGASSASSAVNQGVFTFEPDGTGSASIVQTGLSFPPPPQATSSNSANITFKFTYELMAGGAMNVNMLLDTYTATYLTGPPAAAGLSATFVPVSPQATTWAMSGTISNDRKTLLLNSGNTVLKVRYSNGFEVYVICQFERVLTRLTP